MFESLKIWLHQGKQYIPDVETTEVPGIFRGRPVIKAGVSVDEKALQELCPMNAIDVNPLSIDLGKCSFCGECAFAYPEKISFTKDFKMGHNIRERLIIKEGEDQPIRIDADAVRKEIRRLFGRSLKLRQVSAGGDGSCEMELNATGNVNFDVGRFGIDFVASPRHADGIVLTGPVSENMADSFLDAYDAVPDPKVLILAGTDAISGGLFAGSPAVRRSVLDDIKVDLYLPGNPVHPLTFVNGVLGLLGRMKS
ncbi:MAG: NADH:ubiquinone oxidoreductase [Marinilabiliaceae bacterium]|nr:NADH:ubiquinone oxidoreductase [Marinilabiliaceae bacterium]